MNVLVSSKRGVSSIRRLRHSPTAERSVAPASQRASEAPPRVPESRRRQELGRQRDQAQYTCQCGFVFKAAVSTSVDCPHCGGAQAW